MKSLKFVLPMFLWFFSQNLFAQTIQLDQVASGFNNVVKIAHAGDDRLFVVERSGVIKIIDENGSTLATPFLNIDPQVTQTGGQSEQGLLGLTFHPDYTNNGFFYVNYTDNSGTTKVSRYSVSTADANLADPTSELNILSINQPYGNHNGGEIEFGPDGYLYVGMGDGGSGNDPQHYSQNPASMLGKMLRIDVNGAQPYSIPADNPFVNATDTLDEIWALGLRNPWRFSFDIATGDMWIADVGQWDREEIDLQPADSKGGENYGWRCREGFIDNPNVGNNGCDAPNFVEPIFDYGHSNYGPCSVTGGFAYRSCLYPDIKDFYMYADYCSGDIWGLRPDGQGGWENKTLITIGNGGWTTFGQDAKGEVYVAGLNGGTVYHITSGDAITGVLITDDMGMLSAAAGFESYQWLLDGTPIVDATSANYMPVESGDYTVEATHSSGCIYVSEPFNVIITNVKEIEGLTTFQVSPNPFQGSLSLQLSVEKSAEFQLKIYTLDGRTVFEKQLRGSGTWEEAIDLSDLESAVYLLRLSNGTEELVRKVVKED